MRDGNTMGKAGYIVRHGFWGLIVTAVYDNGCFRCLPGLSRGSSKLALWAALLAFCAVGIALTWDRRRNSLSLFVDLALPFEVYTAVSYWPYMKRSIAAAVATAGIASVVYGGINLCRRVQNSAQRRAVFMRRIANSLLGGRTIAAVCLMALIIPLGAKAAFGYTLYRPSVPAAASSTEEKHTIAGHLDELRKLEEAAWETLDAKARLDLLQVVANIEDTYLGLPHELNVAARDLEEPTVGQYDDSTHTIVVSAARLRTNSAHELLNTVCHEAYHAYQHRICDAYDSLDGNFKDLLLFYKAGKYQAEFDDYQDGDDFEAYYAQLVEIDSRNYAKEAVKDYYLKIKAD